MNSTGSVADMTDGLADAGSNLADMVGGLANCSSWIGRRHGGPFQKKLV